MGMQSPEPTTPWIEGRYVIAWQDHGAHEAKIVSGQTYRGCGLCWAVPHELLAAGPPVGELTHLGSGHLICLIRHEDKDVIVALATFIAEAVDWAGSTPRALIDKEGQIIALICEQAKAMGCEVSSGHPNRGYSDEAAALVAAARVED